MKIKRTIITIGIIIVVFTVGIVVGAFIIKESPSASDGIEILDLDSHERSFPATDEQRNKLYEAVSASEIRAQILMHDKVQNCHVSISMSEAPPSASIVLVLNEGVTLSDPEVQVIIEIVKGSVLDIEKENIFIQDSALNYYPVDKYSGELKDSDTDTSAHQKNYDYPKMIPGVMYDPLTPVFGEENTNYTRVVHEYNYELSDSDLTLPCDERCLCKS